MREILFRGQDENGKWHEGYYYANPVQCFILPVGYETSVRLDSVEVRRETVGQFIGGYGFKDNINEHFKNGQSEEIKLFEGDIVEAWSEGCKGTFVIKMRNESQPTLILYPAHQQGKMWSISFSDLGRDKFNYYDLLRVIGNIHDTPELLK